MESKERVMTDDRDCEDCDEFLDEQEELRQLEVEVELERLRNIVEPPLPDLSKRPKGPTNWQGQPLR